MMTLNQEEKEALNSVVGGADVFGLQVANILRKLEIQGLVTICEAMGEYDSGKDQLPYFGAITNRKGSEALEA
ncbi:MAG: hypothetical protein GY801_11595 [bacterium]|nr:hypothetical protein [bacterium]